MSPRPTAATHWYREVERPKGALLTRRARCACRPNRTNAQVAFRLSPWTVTMCMLHAASFVKIDPVAVADTRKYLPA
jgi:hypothetical protein